MAGLEYKRQVRLPEEFFLRQEPALRRPLPRWPWLGAAWLGFTALCLHLGAGRPLPDWLRMAGERVAEAPVAQRAPVQAGGQQHGGPRGVMGGVAVPVLGGGIDDVGAGGAEGESDEDSGSDDVLGARALARGVAGAGSGKPPDETASEPSPDRPRPEPTGEAPGMSAALAAPLEAPLDADPADEEVKAPRAAASQSSVGQSCEAAAAQSSREIAPGAARPPDVSRQAFAAVLDSGSYFSHCGVPGSMSVSLCVAVQEGRAVGVTVRTDPGSAAIQACIGRAVRGLGFPRHPDLDVVRTHFSAE
ncbi:MAG: hypothetical protein KIT72_12695 [Polyangiaceae bacterium]|nr:hypothetical protein [Polyangiaceae bacterium]MCW5791271.1 hypothetical protein [Polyangiaceae bacterium]